MKTEDETNYMIHIFEDMKFEEFTISSFLGSKLIPNRCSMLIRIELVRNNAPASKSKVK